MLRKEQEKIRQDFIEQLMLFFPTELTVHYFAAGMRTTVQLVSDERKPDNWTTLISAYKKDKKPEQIQIEAERTVTSLFNRRQIKERQYEKFTSPQKIEEKLSEDSFKKLCDEVKEIVKDKSTEIVLDYLIAYSDLGKSPHTRELAQKFGIDPLLDTDDIILEILKLPDEKVAAIFPSFAKLEKAEKELLQLAYPLMTACIGHLFFLEGGIKTLEPIAEALKNIPQEKREQLLKLIFLAGFFDATGSQGQVDSHGSLTCIQKFFEVYFKFILQMLLKLNDSFNETKDVQKSSRLALESYLEARAKLIELDISTFKKKEDFECVLRLACCLRIFDPALAKELQTQFYKLNHESQRLLSSQLNFSRDQGLNKFDRDPHYGIATAVQTYSFLAFKENKFKEGIALALEAAICFAAMVQELNTHYEAEVLDPKYPLSFGGLAVRGRESGFFDPASFDPTIAKWALPQPIPETTIKNIIVDVGHVLIRIDKSRRNTVYKAFSELSKKSLFQVSAILNEPFMQNHIYLYECGKMTSAAFRAVIKEKLEMLDVTDEQFDKAWCASLMDDAKAVNERLAYLDQLSKKGYRIFLLSNTNEIHLNGLKERFGASRWGKYFFKQYYSHQIGNCKPNSAVFQQIIKENQLKPAETAFFDDIMPYDIAARKEGIFARQLTVNRNITDILPMIRAIDDAKERKVDVTSTSTLGIFALQKWKELVTRKKEEKQQISTKKLHQV